jgi:hypothetical protein
MKTYHEYCEEIGHKRCDDRCSVVCPNCKGKPAKVRVNPDGSQRNTICIFCSDGKCCRHWLEWAHLLQKEHDAKEKRRAKPPQAGKFPR